MSEGRGDLPFIRLVGFLGRSQRSICIRDTNRVSNPIQSGFEKMRQWLKGELLSYLHRSWPAPFTILGARGADRLLRVMLADTTDLVLASINRRHLHFRALLSLLQNVIQVPPPSPAPSPRKGGKKSKKNPARERGGAVALYPITAEKNGWASNGR